MLKQHLQFKLSQKLSPQQIQLMKLIQLPTQAFEQRLKQELEENPALENGKDENENIDDSYDEVFDDSVDNESINAEDINIDDYLSDDETPDYRTKTNNYSIDDDEKSIPYASGTSFNQYLLNQLNTVHLSDEEWAIAEFLVGSVDQGGYIRRPISDIMDDLAFTQNIYTNEIAIEKVLNTVQELDPPGVAARSLDECLIIQLKRKETTPSIELAITILEKSFEQFTKKHYKKLISKYNITESQLKDTINEIEKLNPRPGGSYSGGNRMVEHVVPDFSIKINEIFSPQLIKNCSYCLSRSNCKVSYNFMTIKISNHSFISHFLSFFRS